jgi:ubiquinone/menaquinone biosynthesis C-methylase UbiE
LSKLRIGTNDQILDVGAGLGQFSRTMARLASKGKVIGVERDKAQLKTAITLAHQSGEMPLVEFRLGDAYALPLQVEEWGSFDLVHCRYVLEHLEHPQKAVDQMAKAVSENGRIVLVDDDHTLFRLYPELPGFDQIWESYIESFRKLGNEPNIGRQIIDLLYKAGCTKIKNDFVSFGSWKGDPNFKMYTDNIKGILVGAEELMIEHNLIARKSIKSIIDAFDNWSSLPSATIWYPLNWAEGII